MTETESITQPKAEVDLSAEARVVDLVRNVLRKDFAEILIVRHQKTTTVTMSDKIRFQD